MHVRTPLIATTAACLIALLGACTPTTVGQGEVGETGAPAKAAAEVKTATWGQRYTWKDGLALEVAAPKPCKPSKYAMPNNIERAVNFKITLINGTDKPVDAAMVGVGIDAQFDGAKADDIMDVEPGTCSQADGSGTVLPGKTISWFMSYAVPKTEGEMQLTFSPTFFGGDKGIFVGRA